MRSFLNTVGAHGGAVCFAFVLSASVLACSDDGTDEMGDGTMGDTMGDGDPGDGDPTAGDGDPGDLTFAGDIGPLLTASCGCHAEGGSAALTLVINYANIVDVASTQAPAVNLVTTGDSGASYIVNKMRNTQGDVGGLGNPMPPPPAATLAESDIAMVEAWIDAGAMP